MMPMAMVLVLLELWLMSWLIVESTVVDAIGLIAMAWSIRSPIRPAEGRS